MISKSIYTDDWIIDVSADNLSIGEGPLGKFKTCRTAKTDLLQVVKKQSQLQIIQRNPQKIGNHMMFKSCVLFHKFEFPH